MDDVAPDKDYDDLVDEARQLLDHIEEFSPGTDLNLDFYVGQVVQLQKKLDELLEHIR